MHELSAKVFCTGLLAVDCHIRRSFFLQSFQPTLSLPHDEMFPMRNGETSRTGYTWNPIFVIALFSFTQVHLICRGWDCAFLFWFLNIAYRYRCDNSIISIRHYNWLLFVSSASTLTILWWKLIWFLFDEQCTLNIQSVPRSKHSPSRL